MARRKLLFSLFLLTALGAAGSVVWIKYLQQQALAEAKSEINHFEELTNSNDLNRLQTTKFEIEEALARLETVPQLPGDGESEELKRLQTQLTKVNQKLQPEQQALDNLDQAKKLAMEASILVQNPPHPTQVWYDAKQKWQQAINLLKQIPQQSALFPEAQQKIKSYQGNYAFVSRQFDLDQKAVEFNNVASQKIRDKDYQTALKFLNQALLYNRFLVSSYLNRGVVYSELNSHQSAITNFDTALKIDPKNAQAYYYRADEYFKLGNHQQAIADYDQALSLNPDYAAVYLDRGVVQYQLGNTEQALEDFAQSADLFANQGDTQNQQVAQNYLQQVQSSMPPEEVEENPQVIIEDDPDIYIIHTEEKKAKARNSVTNRSNVRVGGFGSSGTRSSSS